MKNYDEIINSITKKENLKDKILEIIKKENRKLNPIDIIRKIKDDYSADEIREVIDNLESLCKDGILRNASGNTYKLNNDLIGRVDLHEKGNAHVIIEGHDDVFIPRDKMKGACDKDLVSIEIDKKRYDEGRITKILKRSLGSAIAEVKEIEGKITFEMFGNDELPYTVEIKETDMNLVDGMLVHLEYDKDLDKNRVLAKIDKVLGHKNALLNEGQVPTEVSGEIAKIACEYSLRLEFPEEVLEEARKLPKTITDEMIEEGLKDNREDFRGDVVVTIDGKDTKDIDDAVGVKILPNGNYLLSVHIADVSHYVKPGSSIWKEAEIRSTSNYLGNKVLPMLPVELSNGICSLNPNVDRFSLSCIMEINHSGEVVNSKITKGIIHSKKKMNYDAIQDVIDGVESEDTKDYNTLEYNTMKEETLSDIAFAYAVTVDELLELNPDLKGKTILEKGTSIKVPCKQIIKLMSELSKKISANKQRRGELRFSSDETKIHQDESDEPIDIKARNQRPAERIIEDFMVAANEQTARYLDEFRIATFRIHDKPSSKSMKEYMDFLKLVGVHYPHYIDFEDITTKDCQKLLEFLRNESNFEILNKKLLRSMQKARYSIENIGHFALASEKYTHFTSPIRRFDDLLNHTSLSYILDDYSLSETFINSWKNYLSTMCDYISEQEKNSDECEYAVDDMLKARFMEKHIGDEYEATIDSLMQSFFFVQTDNYIDGRVDLLEKSENDYQSIGSTYNYNEKMMSYTKNGKVELKYGDRVKVRCIAADHKKRQVDFALIRKL